MTKKGPACRQAGLTIMEVLITAGISSAIGVLLLVIILNSTGVFYKQSLKLQEGLNINDSLSKIRNNIKQASSVAVSYTSGTTTYTSGATQLILKVLSVDSSNNLIPSTYDYFVFFLDQNKLRFRTFVDDQSSRKAQDQILSTLVDDLSFKYYDSLNPPTEVVAQSAKKVTVTVTLKQKNGINVETHTATSEGNLRND